MIRPDTLRKRVAKVENISEFARKAGISRRTVHRYLAGEHSPTERTQEKMSAGLKKLSRKTPVRSQQGAKG